MSKYGELTTKQKMALYISIDAVCYIYADFAQFIYERVGDYFEK